MSSRNAKHREGCYRYGCIAAAMLAFIFGALLFFFAKAIVQTGVANFTSDTPVTLAEASIDDAVFNKAREKVENFFDGGPGIKPEPMLSLSSQELYALLKHESPELAKGVRFSISDATLDVVMSIPLDDYGLSGKYLNGSGKVRLALEKGALSVFFDEFTVNGKKLPPDVLTQLQGPNLLERISENPVIKKYLSSLSSIEIKNKALLLHRRE